jgi:lipopolysaccharide/colanic/teichoic acid biosynthesis glycosyltransferase
MAEQPQTVRRRAGFYSHGGKRLVDFIASAIALVILSPLLILLALLVKTTSPGAVFYRQPRVGKRGRLFRIVKFRSMSAEAETSGPDITVAGDPRITTVGKILRRWKLDELPQLWNVLKGEMSLVGPRPELPAYVAGYTDAQREVLTVRPGITDPASLAYHREEELLATHAAPQRFYRETILPHKLAMNREYVAAISFRGDVTVLLRTANLLLGHPSAAKRRRIAAPGASPG